MAWEVWGNNETSAWGAEQNKAVVWLLAFVNSFCLRYIFFYFPRHYGELFLINYVKSRVVGLVKHSFVFFSNFSDLNSEIGIVIKLLEAYSCITLI